MHVDLARLARIRAQLGPADAACVDQLVAVAERAAPAYIRRGLQHDRRDAAIRCAASTFGDLPPWRRARATERALGHYLRKDWHDDRHYGPPDDRTPLRAALFDVARLNGGRGLQHGQIYNVLRGSRSGRGAQFSTVVIAPSLADAAGHATTVQPQATVARARATTDRAA